MSNGRFTIVGRRTAHRQNSKMSREIPATTSIFSKGPVTGRLLEAVVGSLVADNVEIEVLGTTAAGFEVAADVGTGLAATVPGKLVTGEGVGVAVWRKTTVCTAGVDPVKALRIESR